MLTGAVLATFLSSSLVFPLGQQAQPIGDSMRRAANETAKFYGRQWQMEGEALKVILIEPGGKYRFNGSYTKETVSFVFAGQNNGSKLEMNIMDPATKEVVENAELDSLGSIYFMPTRSKTYTMEILNKGKANDFVTLVEVRGGLGAQLPLSKIKFLASSQGHALYEMAASGEAILPLNTPFLRAAVVPAKGTFSAPVSLGSAKTTVIGYGEEDTISLKANIVDAANKRLKTLEDNGSGARFLELASGLAKASKIQLTNPLNKRVVYSWAVFTSNN
jgi:hypothetical protein